jgi:hypothetical protein
MTTADQMRKLALALPQTEEKSHFGQPDFRVCDKIFAGLSREETRGTLKLTPELQAVVVSAKPEAYFPAAGAWGDKGWTQVELARVEPAELEELVVEAWRMTAPKRLVAERDGATAAPGAAPKARGAAPRSTGAAPTAARGSAPKARGAAPRSPRSARR